MTDRRVRVTGLPPWMDAERLLGPGEWTGSEVLEATLDTESAADLAARLRGLGFGGQPVEVQIRPQLKRPAVRAARTRDARRRRDTTPGFTRRGARLDAEGRMSLTPEVLALALGRSVAPCRVLDAGCGAGGNSIGFARAGCTVLAVERDPARLEDARHNASLYGVTVRFCQRDALAAAEDADVDLIFVDPPWGADWGRSVCTAEELPLLTELAEIARRRGLRWVAKVPPSFDPSTVPGATAEAWFGAAEGDRQRVKFVVLRIG